MFTYINRQKKCLHLVSLFFRQNYNSKLKTHVINNLPQQKLINPLHSHLNKFKAYFKTQKQPKKKLGSFKLWAFKAIGGHLLYTVYEQLYNSQFILTCKSANASGLSFFFISTSFSVNTCNLTQVSVSTEHSHSSKLWAHWCKKYNWVWITRGTTWLPHSKPLLSRLNAPYVIV